jgi:hypothetical protein
MNGERYRGAIWDLGLPMQHEPAPGPRTRHDDIGMKVSWLVSKGKPALEFAAASGGPRGWPKNPRAVPGPACVVRRRSFEYGILGLPLAMKAEPSQLKPGRPENTVAPSAWSAITITIIGRANRRPVQ